MGGESDVGSLAVLYRMGDHVAGPVNSGDAAESTELGQHPFRTALLEKCRRGNTADLQVLFVNPEFFAIKPLERFAQRGIGEFGNQLGQRSGLAGESCRSGDGGQMPV